MVKFMSLLLIAFSAEAQRRKRTSASGFGQLSSISACHLGSPFPCPRPAEDSTTATITPSPTGPSSANPDPVLSVQSLLDEDSTTATITSSPTEPSSANPDPVLSVQSLLDESPAVPALASTPPPSRGQRAAKIDNGLWGGGDGAKGEAPTTAAAITAAPTSTTPMVTRDGQNCIFPMKYKNVLYDTCIIGKSQVFKYWCATTKAAAVSGVYGSSNWGPVAADYTDDCTAPQAAKALVAAAARNDCFNYGIAYHGNTFLKDVTDIQEAAVCQELCQNTNRCLSWTWTDKGEEANVCNLKSTDKKDGGNVSKPGKVSGPKNCDS